MQDLNEIPQFTRYNIERTLGSGGMGTVYLAHHNILNREVALKVPKRELAQNEVFVERFLREARALGTLNHPHIVTVYDAGIEQSIPYIAMEYVDGDTLANSILHTGQIDITLAISWGIQMAKALAYLHHQQILHRDLKSANVIIDRAGNAVIADFGIAQIDQDSSLTRGMLGTPAYISPEQARGAQLDARSDLYSLGVILYESLTGRLPFMDDNGFALIQKVIHEAPQDIWNHRPDAPPWLCDLINKCLEKDPERRFQNGTELASALQQGLPDNTSLMRAEPPDTIVSQHLEKTGTLADQFRDTALTNVAMSFRRPTNPAAGAFLPFVDPSPTVTMYGESQIIKPEKRDNPIKAMMNPLSAVMTFVILTALVLIPLTEMPPNSASGQQHATEASFPVGPPLHAEESSAIQPATNRDNDLKTETASAAYKLEPAPIVQTDSTMPDLAIHKSEPEEHPADTAALRIDSLDAEDDVFEILPFEEDIAAELEEPQSTVASTETLVASEDSATLALYLPTPPLEEAFDPETESDSSFESITGDAEIDLTLLEDQLEVQSAIIEAGTYDTRVPQSIAALSTLKNRTQLVRALATYQAQKVLLFGSKTNVKEPDLAFIFLINKENKKVRGLLAPSPEGWTDIYTGKIVTEEKGRFYEREPNSEVTLKWWLHDVTPIWVELKQKQKMVARPVPGKSRKKRLGW